MAMAAAKRGAKNAGPSIFPTASACTTMPLSALMCLGHASQAVFEAEIAAVTPVRIALCVKDSKIVEKIEATSFVEAASIGIASTNTAAANGATTRESLMSDSTCGGNAGLAVNQSMLGAVSSVRVRLPQSWQRPPRSMYQSAHD